MLHGRKWWAKNEDAVMGDTRLEENAPIDSFKENHVYKRPKEETYEKAAT